MTLTAKTASQYLDARFKGSPQYGSRPNFQLVSQPWENSSNAGYQAGSQLPAMVNRSKLLRPLGAYANLLRDHPLPAFLVNAGIGGIAGAVIGKMNDKNPTTSGMLGALAGGAGSAVVSNAMSRNMKSASFYPPQVGSVNYIANRLSADPSMGPSDKAGLFAAINKLGPAQLQELVNLLRGSFGTAAGALIARFCLGLGFLGTAAGALAGNFLSGHPFSSPNALGQPGRHQTDPFGYARMF